MKKFVSIFLATAILLGVIVAFPVFAEGESATVYKKDSVIKATVVMPSNDSIVGIEGKLTYDSTKLEYCANTLEKPNISNLVFNADIAGEIPFNCSSTDSYDLSTDHIIMSAQFTVLADTTAEAFSVTIDDAYTLGTNGTTFIDASTTARVDIVTVQDAPSSKIIGDANGNGRIDAQDVLFIRRYNASLSVPATFDADAADVNRNGMVDAQDVLYMRRHNASLSIPPTIKIGEAIS